MKMRAATFVLFVLAWTSAWGRVLVHWTGSALPLARELGVNEIVLSWSEDFSTKAKLAERQGYRVYAELPLSQAEKARSARGLEGIVLNVRASERAELERLLPKLRAAHPKIKFLVLNAEGKQPQMRGSLVIKKGAVLEVSSPTAQPWIDTNLALVKMERRLSEEEVPLYTFSWEEASEAGQQPSAIRASDYSLAVAEAGAFHADLVLNLDEGLQKGLIGQDAEAWAAWKQVRAYADFYAHAETRLAPAANVAVVDDDPAANEEVMNLLARHNIPFEISRMAELNVKKLDGFDVVVVFGKPDKGASDQIAELARLGKIVLLVEARGSYPWQSGEQERLNEHAVSYALGKGKVIELSEAVSDPETFAQDIRRLLGKDNALISLFNGLTTIAVPYRERGKAVSVIEFVNFAGEPLRLQVEVKGSFPSIRYETPEHKCCETLMPVKHGEFTEFVIPELLVAGRVHLDGGR
jgi:NAD(P)-dependent dehydrogenase (short-subunit alcohol dehydrogenase family)